MPESLDPGESCEEIRRDFGREFEEEVKLFLEEKFRFEAVKKNIHIAPEGKSNEVDVCGRRGDILFVFQCRAAGRRSNPNLIEKIMATRERAKIVLENYKNVPEYSSCKFVVFVFITKKIDLPDAQKRLLEEGSPKIWYANESVLEYYSDLYDKIGDFAVYNFLADFGIRPDKSEQMYVTALRSKLGNYNVYSFYVRPKQLLKFSYVARRRSSKEDFYQRMLEKSRIKKIQNYLDSGGIFPTNLIISLKSGEQEFRKINCPELPRHVDIGILTIKNSYNACWIIDGQHRLYSFAKSRSRAMVPCIAFNNLSIEDEKSFFVSINKKQKPIQPDLLWDLAGKMNPSNNEEQIEWIISNIVRKLYFREPFKEKIYIPVYGSKSGKSINMAAFCNGILNSRISLEITPNCVGNLNPLFANIPEATVNRVSSALEKYFNGLNSFLGEQYKNFIFGNAGIPIMLYLLEPIIARIGKIPKIEDLNKYIFVIKKFFEETYSLPEQIDSLGNETTSEGSRKNMAKQIGDYIKRELNDKDFWPKMEESDFVNDIISMERRLALCHLAN